MMFKDRKEYGSKWMHEERRRNYDDTNLWPMAEYKNDSKVQKW